MDPNSKPPDGQNTKTPPPDGQNQPGVTPPDDLTPKNNPPIEPDLITDDLNPTVLLDGNVDMEKLQKILADRNRKGKIAKELQLKLESTSKERDELMKDRQELNKIKQSQMTEHEKLQAQFEELSKQNATLKQQSERDSRLRMIARHGVLPEYEDFFDGELGKAQQNDNFMEDEWFEQQKKSRPVMFSGSQQSLPTGSGPQRSGSTGEIDQLRDKIKNLSEKLNPREEDKHELLSARMQLQRLESARKTTGA